MGNIMISVNDDNEREIRKYAQEIYGGKKGSLSEFVWAAIADYISHFKKEYDNEISFKRMIERAKHAKKLGILNKDGMAYTSRDELYER
ncbi:MAG: hypothetical protein Q7S22_00750 [Candidatus Micrarchaeota archaeon]|nr:hypothetical protein [Candidatus Micrarchaeota archaeon]